MVALYNQHAIPNENGRDEISVECYGRELALLLLKCTFSILLGDDCTHIHSGRDSCAPIVRVDFADMANRTAKRFYEIDEVGLAKIYLSESQSMIHSLERTSILSHVINTRMSKVKFQNRILKILAEGDSDFSATKNLFNGVNDLVALPVI